jgi:predicted nucleic acid-binding protein
VRTAGETEVFWRSYRAVADDSVPSGNLVPDAHIVALTVENDVRTIWTRDRDFRRLPRIEVRDPFA